MSDNCVLWVLFFIFLLFWVDDCQSYMCELATPFGLLHALGITCILHGLSKFIAVDAVDASVCCC